MGVLHQLFPISPTHTLSRLLVFLPLEVKVEGVMTSQIDCDWPL